MIKIGKITLLEKIILLGFYLSGFAALTYEQVWTQLLFLIFGTSTYAFSVMLTAFFIGLALGSHIMGRYVDRIDFPILWFSFIEIWIGLCGLLLLPAFSMLDLPYLLFFQKVQSPYLFMLSWFFLPFWLLVPTALMGATLPIVSKIFASERERIGADIGLLYSVNTFGGIIGSFSAGFILIPYIGLVKTCVLAATSNIIVAFVIFFYSEGLLHVQEIYKTRKARYFINMKRWFYLFLAVSLLLCVYINSYKINPTFAGAYYAGMRMASIEEWKETKENFNILYNKYGLYGLVVVGTDEENRLYLSINGKTEASTAPSDIATQYLIAYIPMLVHENPSKVLNIGLGAGFTLSAIENLEVDKIDCIEINPTVVEVAEKYFSEYTDNALADPRLNLIIADGRNYLSHSEEKYDVIISEPSNPWISGEGSLFTKEFFEIVRDHLAEGGIFCQWAPMYEHDIMDFKILLKTFNSVFPYVQVYNSGADVIILGSDKKMKISYPRLVEKLSSPEIYKDFVEMKQVTEVGREVSSIDKFLSTYKMDSKDVREYVKGDLPLNTDDHTILEFRTATNAVKKRGAEGEIPVIGPLQDILDFKTEKRGRPSFAPPITGLVHEEDSRDILLFLNMEVEKMPDWKLSSVNYEYIHMIAPSGVFLYMDNKYVKYELPNSGILIAKSLEMYSRPSADEVGMYVKTNLGCDLLNVSETRIGEHTAYLFDISLEGGRGRGLSAAWYCDENNALYITAIAYPRDNWNREDAGKALSSVKCIMHAID